MSHASSCLNYTRQQSATNTQSDAASSDKQTDGINSTTPRLGHTVIAIEVKSENDKLSRWQILWLELLCRAGIATEVLKVNPSPSTAV